MKEGDILIKHSSGGGGVGNAAERDPEMVRKDVHNGLVSFEAARDIYKVAVDPKTFKVDEAATKKLREQSAG